MPLCRVYGCNTSTGQTDIPCHRFPSKDLDTARKWLIACRIEFSGSLKNYNFKHKVVCGLHFTPTDYEEDLFSQLMLDSGKIEKARPKKLKDKAVPTLNLFTKPSEAKPKPRATSIQRAERTEKQAQKRSIVNEVSNKASTTTLASSSSSDEMLEEVNKCKPVPRKKRRRNKRNSGETSNNKKKSDQASVPSTLSSPPPVSSSNTTPVILPEVEFDDFPLKKNAGTQVAPETIHVHKRSADTQTDWTDPIHNNSKMQVTSATPANSDHTYNFTTPAVTPHKPPSTPLQTPQPEVTPHKPPSTPLQTPQPVKPRRIEYKDAFVDVQQQSEKRDPDYQPSSSDSSSDEEESSEEDIIHNVVNDSKYIIFDSCLRSLISQVRCSVCGSVLILDDLDDTKYSVDRTALGHLKGSMLTIKASCLQGHPWSWGSQPLIGKGRDAVPAGNLMLSASMLFSGISFAKASHFASFMNLRFISEGCMIGHEGDFIFPVVHESWYREKHTLWNNLENTPVQVSGDGRCDSPGYSAKYCTYVMMDMDTEKVIAIETLSVNETSSSNAMEKEACHRLLEELEANNVEVGVLCTDRHASIAKMIREDYPDIDHQFDLWHLAKSVTKKLHAKARLKDCQDLNMWIPSIKNHLWWSAASCDGNTIELIEKWRSVVHHVVDRHELGGSQQYHECVHGALSEEEREAKKWLEEGSEAHEALGSVINDKNLLKGVNQVNLFCHTGKTEVFNSSLLKFCPKRNHYTYEGMVVRTKLAAIDNNMNTGRVQARVKHQTKRSGPVGSLRYSTVYPKAKKQWVAKPIYEGKQYGYVYDLIEEVLLRKLANKKGTEKMYFDPPAKALKKNIAAVENPGKALVVVAHQSRFPEHIDMGCPIGL